VRNTHIPIRMEAIEWVKTLLPAVTSAGGVVLAAKMYMQQIRKDVDCLTRDHAAIVAKLNEIHEDMSDMKVKNAEDHGAVKSDLSTLKAQMKIVLK